jgi:pimeloyl-ACP methyl ester carboxylesterase
MLNDWSFASAIAWGRRRSYTKRIDVFADALARAVGTNGADEVLVVGHSLGAVLAVESLAAAMERSPELAHPKGRVTLMTVGSSLLKVALHPAARRLRRAIGSVLNATDIAWIDYSAIVDPLNFYRTDPGKALGLVAPRSPILRTVKIRTMLGEKAYQRFKRNFLRLHRQFVMGNGQRYHYDFFMSCCGPMAQADRIDNPTLSVESFGENGSYRPIADGTHNTPSVQAATAL